MNEIINQTSKNFSTYKTLLVEEIVFNDEFRKYCEDNVCEKFCTNWACPPYVGSANECINHAKSFTTAIVVKDTYKIESRNNSNRIELSRLNFKEKLGHIQQYLNNNSDSFLILAAGECNICNNCSVLTNNTLHFPKRVYIINFSLLC